MNNMSLDLLYRIVYSSDASRNASKRQNLTNIVFPRTPEEIAGIVRYCRKRGTPIYIKGAGTSLTGAGSPTGKGIMLSTEKMDRILNFSYVAGLIRTEAGISAARINDYLNEHSLFLPVFPASYKFSSIGGNISTNASGFEAGRFGGISNYLKSLRVITGKGEDLNIGAHCHRYSQGIDIKNLFIGSLGLLGIICETEFGVIPKPARIYEYIFRFRQLGPIFDLFFKMRRKGIHPVRFEIVNDTISTLLLNSNYYYIEIHADSSLFPGRSHLKFDRSSVSPMLSSVMPYKKSFDLSFDIEALPEFDALLKGMCTKHFLALYYGHFTDGIFHTSFLYDEKAVNIEKNVETVYNFIAKKRGAFSGEHGYGPGSKAIMRKALAGKLPYIRKIKSLFDPDNIMNRGLAL